MPHMKDELHDFLHDIHPHLSSSTLAPSKCQDSTIHLNVVAKVLTEAAEWAERHSEGNLHKVSVSMYV